MSVFKMGKQESKKIREVVLGTPGALLLFKKKKKGQGKNQK
jgi:hypothetical protein